MAFTIRICICLTLLAASFSCATSDGKNRQHLTVNGTVRVVGNEPLTQVVLTPGAGRDKKPGGDYLVLGPLAAELRRDFQGRVVTLKGKECTSPVPRFSNCLKPDEIIVE